MLESQHGRYERARKVAVRALSVAEREQASASVRARLQINLAVNLAELGRTKEALDLLAEAVHTDADQAAASWSARGLMLIQERRFDEALDALNNAVRLAQAGTRPRAAALLNRGLLHMSAGRLAAATDDTAEAATAAAEAADVLMTRMARHNLGYLKFLAGDIPGSLTAMEQGGTVDDLATAVPAMDRAVVLRAAGLLTEASGSIAVAIESFGINHAVSQQIDALLISAEIEAALGRPDVGLKQAQRAGQLAGRRGYGNVALVARLVALRISIEHDAVSRNRWRPPQVSDLVNRLEAVGLVDDAVEARSYLAEAHLHGGNVDAARDALQNLPSYGRSHNFPARIHSRLIAGRLLLADSHRTAAFTELSRGLDELADFQARFGSQDMQSAAAFHGSRLARLGLRTAVESGSPAAILRWLERARAVSTRLPAITPPADPELAERLGELRLASRDARAATLAGRPDPALQRRVAELRQQVRARTWTVAGQGRAARPISLAEAQRRLAADPAAPTVLALLTGDDQVHALVIDRRRATFRTLAPWTDGSDSYRRLIADLDLLATPRVPDPVRRVAKRSLATALARLETELLGPVLGLLGSGPIRLIAVGELATLPWSMLGVLRGRPISVHSSVTAGMAPSTRPERRVLAVAGPDVPEGPAEVAQIAAGYPRATVLTGAGATGATVLQHIPDRGVLHIAAHGRHETDNPLFSSVHLADGPLFGYDLAGQPHRPAQVVLASCDVGQSHLRPGGEPLGLAAALLRSGVSTVVAGIARVSDTIAGAVMVDYHRRLAGGQDAATALSQAMLAAGDEPAPFTCFGTP